MSLCRTDKDQRCSYLLCCDLDRLVTLAVYKRWSKNNITGTQTGPSWSLYCELTCITGVLCILFSRKDTMLFIMQMAGVLTLYTPFNIMNKANKLIVLTVLSVLHIFICLSQTETPSTYTVFDSWNAQSWCWIVCHLNKLGGVKLVPIFYAFGFIKR